MGFHEKLCQSSHCAHKTLTKLIRSYYVVLADGQLLDVLSVGFGLFNMDEWFKYSQNDVSWKYSKIGELSSEELVYSLSLYSYLKNEINPEWLNEVNISHKQKVSETIRFLFENDLNALDERLISR